MVMIAESFREQARWCGQFGSPFTEQLLLRAADDLDAGGVARRLVGEWPGNPRADALSLRFAGALHAAVLTRRDPALAAAYPASDSDWSLDRVWPLAAAFLVREEAWVRQFMTSPPQTNETGRATGLAAGFMWLAERLPEPFHLLELGASAGLNLNWDKFRYAYAPWGRTEGTGPLIPTVVSGAPPAWRDIAIASRAACDQNPLDPAAPEARLRLAAYVWADQTERLQRLARAIELATQSGVKVEAADAAEWTARKLAPGLPEGTTVIYHSVFFQYPPESVRQAIRNAIEAAGAKADSRRTLAWLRLEPEAVLTSGRQSARYVLNAKMWPDTSGAESHTLADADAHGRTLDWA